MNATLEDKATTRQSTPINILNLMNAVNGFDALDQEEDGVIPNQLLGTGNHFENIPWNRRGNP